MFDRGHPSISKTQICAAILAGGASRRMGVPKALIPFEGKPLIRRIALQLGEVFASVLVVTSSDAIAKAVQLPSVEDSLAGKGPLAGIYAALSYFGKPVFCVACDMPHLNIAFIRYMLTVEENADALDALVPRNGRHLEPLHALYYPSCLPVMERELQQEATRSLSGILNSLNIRFVEESEAQKFDPQLRMFENWNTPADLPHSTEHGAE